MAGGHGCDDPRFHFFRMLSFLLLVFSFSSLTCTLAQPATIPFTSCFSGNTSLQLNVSTVYAQFFSESSRGPYLNITLLGQNPQQIIAASDQADPVASMQAFLTARSILV